MTKFCIFWRMRTMAANFLYFHWIMCTKGIRSWVLINTLDRYRQWMLDQHLIDTLVGKPANNTPSTPQSTKYRSGCWWSITQDVDGGYPSRVSIDTRPQMPFSTHDSFHLDLNAGITNLAWASSETNTEQISTNSKNWQWWKSFFTVHCHQGCHYLISSLFFRHHFFLFKAKYVLLYCDCVSFRSSTSIICYFQTTFIQCICQGSD